MLHNLPLGLIACVALAVFTVGCEDRNTFVPPPPPEVGVMAPVIGDVTVLYEFPGRTEAFERAEIRARVRGFLKEIKFEPGSFVEAGTPLFLIEPDEFEAAVATAEGRLLAAQAQQGIADTNFERRSQAATTGAVSAIDVESARAEATAAAAAVSIAEAALADARRSLDYTVVTSPISGRVSDNRVDVGNLVGADGPTLLTTVVRNDPIFVTFEGNERDLLDYLETLPRAGSVGFTESFLRVPVKLTLSDGRQLLDTGRMDFVDNQVNPATGTIRLRAVFDNPEGRLTTGLFVRVGLPHTMQDAILLPSEAVQRDIGGDFVVVVGEGDIAQRRPVTLTRFRVNGQSVITAGVTAGDRVVVSNLQRARPGLPVNPVAAPGRGAKAVADASEQAPEAEEAAAEEGDPAAEEDSPGDNGQENEA